MPLTDIEVKKAKPTDKPYKMADGSGLYLLINTVGKYWRMDYRFADKRKTLALGVYPDTSLAKAREKRDEARKLLADGIDPMALKKASKTQHAERDANSFEVIAREWFAKNLHTWVDSHSSKIIRRLERDVFPWIGGKPIATLTAPEILATIRRIEARGAVETAHRAMQNVGQAYAMPWPPDALSVTL